MPLCETCLITHCRYRSLGGRLRGICGLRVCPTREWLMPGWMGGYHSSFLNDIRPDIPANCRSDKQSGGLFFASQRSDTIEPGEDDTDACNGIIFVRLSCAAPIEIKINHEVNKTFSIRSVLHKDRDLLLPGNNCLLCWVHYTRWSKDNFLYF